MEFPTEIVGETAVITVNADLDSEIAGEALLNALEEALESGKNVTILDLSRVQVVNSYGLGKIFGCYKKVKDNQGELRVKAPQGFIKEMMTLLMIDSVIPIDP